MALADERLTLIVMLIDLTRNDVSGRAEADYHADRALADATAFRVMHIGENAIRLPSTIRARHAHLPWRDMAATRNLVAHNYLAINYRLIWGVVFDFLDELRQACVAELAAAKTQGE